MAIDFTKPAVTDAYATLLAGLQASHVALAQMLDSAQTIITGAPPAYAKRYNRGTSGFEEFDGAAWNPAKLQGLVLSGANIGIGTAAPTASFHLFGNTFQQNDATLSYGYRVTTATTKNTFAGINGSAYFAWQTANSGSDQMVLDTAGNLGVGNASGGHRVLAYTGGAVASCFQAANGSTGAASANGTLFGVDGSGNGLVSVQGGFPLTLLTAGAERMRLDASGSLGLGVTPGNWAGLSNSTFESFSYQLLNVGANSVSFSQNVTSSGGGIYRYKATFAASMFQQQNGAHLWLTAPSGAAGNPITFTQAMTLDASGNLGVGVSAPLNPLHIHSAANTAMRVSTAGGVAQFRGYVFGNTAADAVEYGAIKMELAAGELRIAAGFAAWGGIQTFYTNGLERLRITSAGRIQDASGNELGYKGLPQNAQSAAYTLVLSDAGKCIYHPASDVTARTFTIPANASVAFDIGTVVAFDNEVGAGAVTIAINTDTLVMDVSGLTGPRTLAAGGVATARKVTATRWRISGSGLS